MDVLTRDCWRHIVSLYCWEYGPLIRLVCRAWQDGGVANTSVASIAVTRNPDLLEWVCHRRQTMLSRASKVAVLATAALHGHADVVWFVLREWLPMSVVTAVQYATQGGHLALVEALCARYGCAGMNRAPSPMGTHTCNSECSAERTQELLDLISYEAAYNGHDHILVAFSLRPDQRGPKSPLIERVFAGAIEGNQDDIFVQMWARIWPYLEQQVQIAQMNDGYLKVTKLDSIVKDIVCCNRRSMLQVVKAYLAPHAYTVALAALEQGLERGIERGLVSPEILFDALEGRETSKSFKQNILWTAVSAGCEDIVDLCLDEWEIVPPVEWLDDYAEHVAGSGNVRVLQRILQVQPQLVATRISTSVVCRVARMPTPAMLQFLCEKTQMVSLQGRLGTTVVCEAIKANRLETVKYCLGWDSVCCVQTALACAREEQRPEIVAYLEQLFEHTLPENAFV